MVNKMLSSWKEIALFFGKGVRTVQRWEKTLNLPIRRPPGAPSNVVLARTSDLEAWMHRGPGKAAIAQDDTAGAPSGELALLHELEAEIRALVTNAGGSLPVREESGVDSTSVSEQLEQLLADLRSTKLSGPHSLKKAA